MPGQCRRSTRCPYSKGQKNDFPARRSVQGRSSSQLKPPISSTCLSDKHGGRPVNDEPAMTQPTQTIPAWRSSQHGLILTSADLQELRKLGNIRSIFSGAISAASSPALIIDANKSNLDAQYELAHGDVPIGRVLPTTSLPKAPRGGGRSRCSTRLVRQNEASKPCAETAVCFVLGAGCSRARFTRLVFADC